MERNDLVDYPMQLSDGTSFIIRTHPNPDMDEVLGSWLIRLRATKEWIIENSQEIDGQRVIFLGVGDASQRGVFNEHAKRDVGGDNSDSCATLVAKSLGIFNDPVLKPLIMYGLAEDTEGSKSPFDLPTFLKHGRKLKPNNAENIRWALGGLDIWLAKESVASELPEAQQAIYRKMSGSLLNIQSLYTAARLTPVETVPNSDEWLNIALDVYEQAEIRKAKAAEWTKAHAQEHHVVFAGNRFTYYIVETDDEFAVDGFFSWSRAPMLVRLEPNGRFQIFMRGDASLGSEVFSRLIHKITANVNLIPDEVLKKPIADQIRWVRYEQPIGSTPYWMWRVYFHPKMAIIFNGSLTAYYQEPLIGNGLTVTELQRVIELGVITAKPRTARPRIRPTHRRASTCPCPPRGGRARCRSASRPAGRGGR